MDRVSGVYTTEMHRTPIRKVFCKVNKVHPCTGTETLYRGTRGIALSFLDHGTRRG